MILYRDVMFYELPAYTEISQFAVLAVHSIIKDTNDCVTPEQFAKELPFDDKEKQEFLAKCKSHNISLIIT